MSKVFVYEEEVFQLGVGLFASVEGFRLAKYKGHKSMEVIRDESGRLYGTIYDMDELSITLMDAYYGEGLLHNRITVDATLQGGDKIEVEMYEFIHAELV